MPRYYETAAASVPADWRSSLELLWGDSCIYTAFHAPRYISSWFAVSVSSHILRKKASLSKNLYMFSSRRV